MAKQGTWAGRDTALSVMFLGLLGATIGGVIVGSSWPTGDPYEPGGGSLGAFVFGLFVLGTGLMLMMVSVVAVGVRIGLRERD
jgi:hypothetical protein